MCSSVASSFNTNWLLSQNIYNNSQQKFWCYIFKSLREPQLVVVIFTSTNPHARYATSSMTKETACVLVVSQKYLCSSPETGHLVVECILRMYAGARAPIGTQLHTQPEACWRVCYLYKEKNACIFCLSEQKTTEQKVKADIHLDVLEWLLHTLSCQCEKDSCKLLVLQPLILHLTGTDKKKTNMD